MRVVVVVAVVVAAAGRFIRSYTTNEMGTPRVSKVCEEFTHLGS
jgi:hypothetical protein